MSYFQINEVCIFECMEKHNDTHLLFHNEALGKLLKSVSLPSLIPGECSPWTESDLIQTVLHLCMSGKEKEKCAFTGETISYDCSAPLYNECFGRDIITRNELFSIVCGYLHKISEYSLDELSEICGCENCFAD